jgi:DNA-binding Lrp family transcriptional regulator
LVEDAPIFYGFWTGDVPIAPLEIAEETVDDALARSAHSVDKTLASKLMNAGVVLGTVYHEDHRETGRIRAFVGVRLRDEFKPADRRRFEVALKEINPREIKRHFSEPLISVYRCASPKFSYLIQLICDDQSQLDRLTDEIQDASDAVWDTNTMIVAKNEERPFLYSSSSAEQADAQVAVGLISDQGLLPLVQSVRRAGPDLASLFDAASVEQQLTAVDLQRDLAEPDGLALPEEFGPFALDLIRGALRDRASDIKNAGQALVRDCVEPAHNKVVSLVVREVFGDNMDYFQSELKMSDKLYWKWGLRVWGQLVYPKWNAHPFLGQLLTVPEGVLWSMGVVGQTRNRFAHVRTSVGNRELIQAAREVFYHAAVVQRWSEEALAVLVDPAVRWRAIRESMLGPKDRQVTRMLEELVSLREQVFAKLDEHRSEMEPQMQSIADTIVAIRDGQTNLNEETLDDLETRMLQVLNSSRGEQAKSGFSYLRKAVEDLPIGVAASLLASILGGAMGLGR